MANGIAVTTPLDGINRLMEIKQQELREQEERDEARRNRNFTQIYPLGWERLREFLKEKQPNAVQLYSFLAEHMDANTGTIVASQALLAERLGIGLNTVKRAIAYLEEKNALVRINLGKGTVQAYCLNPELVWKSFDNKKQYAAFNTKTLARKSDNGEIMKKLKVMARESNNQLDFFPDDENPETQTETPIKPN